MMQGRFELKFLVDAETKHRFLEAVRPGLEADPHGIDAVYRVSSLYFDTPDYRAVWEKLDGESIRRKFRLRYYSLDQQSEGNVLANHAFMEIKHRIDNTVYKQRARLTDPGATAILTDAKQLGRLSAHVADPVDGENQFVIDEIQRSATLQKLRSATVITYLREAWLGTVDHRLRVTFDSSCQAYGPDAFAEVKNNQGTPCLDPNLIVMEVKFDRAVPCWVRDVLVDQQLQLQRFSKYASGVLNNRDSGFRKEYPVGDLTPQPQSACVPPHASTDESKIAHPLPQIDLPETGNSNIPVA